jgi:cell division protein FtsW
MTRKHNDIVLVATVTILLTIGLILVFSASVIVAEERHGSLIYFIQKQVVWGFLCILSIFIFSRFKFQTFARAYVPMFGVVFSVLLLLGLFFFGDRVNGAIRWYNLGIGSFQPSEAAKLALIIYFADIFSRKGRQLRDWKKGLLPHVLVYILMIVLIFLQPDLSSALMITMVIGSMALMSEIRLKHILAGIFMVLPALFLKMYNNGYQLERVITWIKNINNPLGSGYQIKQSLIGLGSGGFSGSGLGASKQKYLFLPDSHTDFIYSILGEEFGFIGTTLVLILFMVLLWRGISIAKRLDNTFGQFLAVGLTMNIVLYGLINIAVVTMVFPATGLPMPFLSYGGTSLLFAGISIGILLNLSKNSGELSYMTEKDGRQQLHKQLMISR